MLKEVKGSSEGISHKINPHNLTLKPSSAEKETLLMQLGEILSVTFEGLIARKSNRKGDTK